MQPAVDEGAEHEIALAEAMLGILADEGVRHAAAEAQVARGVVEPQQMFAERFHIAAPQAPDVGVGGGLGFTTS